MKTITTARRLGVNALILTLSDGTARRLVTSRNEITSFEEATLSRRSREVGIRSAVAGIGRLVKISAAS